MRGSDHMDATCHIDSFGRDNLPPDDWRPDLLYDRPELSYPDSLNAAEALLAPHSTAPQVQRPAVIGPHQSWSYGDLIDQVNRIAAVLVEDFGIIPGNRVLLRGPNTPLLAACWLAVLKCGAILVPTIPLLRPGELQAIHRVARLDLVLCDCRFGQDVISAGPAMPRMVEFSTGPAGTPESELNCLMRGKTGQFTAVATSADDIALIAFTSGTTGAPKAAAHFHRELLAIADLSPRSILGTTADDVFCGSPSLAFAFGIGGMLLFPLRVGASVVLIDRVTPDNLLGAAMRHKASILFTVPTVYRAMITALRSCGLPEGLLSSLRICVSAGEPLPAVTLRSWQELTGLEILDSFGTTEMLNAVLHSPPGAVRPGSTGLPVPGYEVRVVDDDLQTVAPGKVGRLAVRGPTGCLYLNEPKQRDYVRDGWNLTGDAFHMDEDGYFWYHARTDDLIVSAGYKISGLEVENVLLNHDCVEECAVIAAPDPVRGAIPKAYIVTRDGVCPNDDLAAALQDYVKEHIAPFKYPRAVEFIDALPRTETGKVQRYKLRQRDWGVGDGV